ncbi:hypothetical protein C8R44DRAFT_236405 [Mycena epipterygia]|nr:hypothetical protein C8R44DRAFT_236405 [Mycena epipterygia]
MGTQTQARRRWDTDPDPDVTFARGMQTQIWRCGAGVRAWRCRCEDRHAETDGRIPHPVRPSSATSSSPSVHIRPSLPPPSIIARADPYAPSSVLPALAPGSKLLPWRAFRPGAEEGLKSRGTLPALSCTRDRGYRSHPKTIRGRACRPRRGYRWGGRILEKRRRGGTNGVRRRMCVSVVDRAPCGGRSRWGAGDARSYRAPVVET